LDVRDYVMLSEMGDIRPNKFTLSLPNNLHTWLEFENPIPKRLRSFARMTAYIFTAVILFSQVDLNMRYFDMVALDQKTYFLDSSEKKAAYFTAHAAFYYNYTPDFVPYQKDARSYLDSALQLHPDYVPALINKVILERKTNVGTNRHDLEVLQNFYQAGDTIQYVNDEEMRRVILRLVSEHHRNR